MARTRILASVFLLANTLVPAQDVHTSFRVLVGSPANNCPIGVEASLIGLPSASNAGSPDGQPAQRGGPMAEGQIFVRETPPPTGSLQLHLDVSNPSPRNIVDAKFTVHGLSRKLRMIDLSNASNAPDVARTVDATLDVPGNGHASRDLPLAHFTAIITSLDLISVTYADGTPWQAPYPAACRIIPNMVVRIAVTR